jgi:hypothetical protein
MREYAPQVENAGQGGLVDRRSKQALLEMRSSSTAGVHGLDGAPLCLSLLR